MMKDRQDGLGRTPRVPSLPHGMCTSRYLHYRGQGCLHKRCCVFLFPQPWGGHNVPILYIVNQSSE